MSTNDSYAAFKRSFQEKWDTFLYRLNAFPVILSRNDQRDKLKATLEVLTSLRSVKDMLSQADMPMWMLTLENLLAGILASADGQDPIDATAQNLISIVPQARAQSWNFRESKHDVGVDFDAIYGEAFDASKLPGLFDRLIRTLEKIVESGHVDSKKATDALEKLIATLKRSRSGSYASKSQAYHFVKTCFRHVFWNTLETYTPLGVFTKSVRDTIEEMKAGFDELDSSVKLQIDSKTEMEIPMLGMTPKTQLGLPAPKVTDPLNAEA